MTPPSPVFVLFEKGLFLGFFRDQLAAEKLAAARHKHAPHEIFQYVPAPSLRLLAWAVDYIDENNQALIACHRLPDGTIDEVDVNAEIEQAHIWLNQARAILA